MHFTQLDSPCLIVDAAVVKHNIDEMIRMVGDIHRLRPHIKTHKTAEGIQAMMKAGIQKFKCATIAEAELLALNGVKDILLAYQPVGPKVERLYQLNATYPGIQFGCLVDNEHAATEIGNFFHQHQGRLDVYVDLNVGMNRTGIAPQHALPLFKALQHMPGLRFRGLHVYDGQHRQVNYEEKAKACEQGFESVYTLIHAMKSEEISDPIIIAGGSPSFSVHAQHADRDCSPGTNIFWDKGYATICPEQHFEPAVKILTRVISLPDVHKICIDLGHKAVASENEITKRIFFPDHPHLKPLSQSEEHMVLETDGSHTFKPGDMLIGIPYHICPTVALHENLFEVKEGEVIKEWNVVARKRKINI